MGWGGGGDGEPGERRCVGQENHLIASRQEGPFLSCPVPSAAWMEIVWIIAGSEAVHV